MLHFLHAVLRRSSYLALLDEQPGLLNATWDWGGGDFETALGGAAHMGRRDIVQRLCARAIAQQGIGWVHL